MFFRKKKKRPRWYGGPNSFRLSPHARRGPQSRRRRWRWPRALEEGNLTAVDRLGRLPGALDGLSPLSRLTGRICCGGWAAAKRRGSAYERALALTTNRWRRRKSKKASGQPGVSPVDFWL